MKSKTWLILGSVVLGAVFLWLAGSHFSSGVPVEVVEVTTGPIREFVDERAITRLPETYLITMPIPGRIEPITLTEGTPVSKGQVVARIVPRDLDLTVEQADAVVHRLEAAIRENADTKVEETGFLQAMEFVKSMASTVEAAMARVKASEARYEYARKQYERVSDVRERDSGALAEEKLDRAVEQRDTATWNLRQDELVHAAMVAIDAATRLMPTMVRQYIERKSLTGAVLEKQKAEAEVRRRQVLQDQQRGEMTSPVDGVVLARHITNERFLSAGVTLLEIGRLEDLEVEADVLSLDVVEAEVGDPVEIYGPAIGSHPARGSVKRIYPAGFTKISSLGVEQQRVKVIIGFDAEDLARVRAERDLGVGYRVRVRIITGEKSQARVIPRSALFRGAGGDWQVYVVRGGRARIQTVQLGMINDELAEVRAGLQEKELVVRAPESDLVDNQKVTVVGK